MSPTTALKQLRLVGALEGISFLLLLLVAMPVKYLLGEPILVRIVGMAHGALFLAYLYVLVRASVEREWPVTRTAAAFVASVLPFGFLALDGALRREIAEVSAPVAAEPPAA